MNLGLFTRVYPRKGSSGQYSKFWTNGESAVQKLAAAWLEAAEDTVEAETADAWIAQLRDEDTEFETLSATAPGSRPAAPPAPPPFSKQQRQPQLGGAGEGDRVDDQRGQRTGMALQPQSPTKGQTITLQQQLRQRVAERYAQTHAPQPGP